MASKYISDVKQLMGVENQIRFCDFDESGPMPSMEDFKSLMKDMECNSEKTPKNIIFITGAGGYCTTKLKMAFYRFGKKLPRKLKKRVFGTKKLRQQFLPEYYGK